MTPGVHRGRHSRRHHNGGLRLLQDRETDDFGAGSKTAAVVHRGGGKPFDLRPGSYPDPRIASTSISTRQPGTASGAQTVVLAGRAAPQRALITPDTATTSAGSGT